MKKTAIFIDAFISSNEKKNGSIIIFQILLNQQSYYNNHT